MNMLKMFKLIFSLSFLIVGIKSAKILGIFPIPSISHQVVFRPVMQELAKLGHEVTVITTDPAFPKDHTPQNLTEIDIHDISYAYWNKMLAELGREKDALVMMNFFVKTVVKLSKIQFQTPVIQKFFHETKKIDLILVESWVRPFLIFSHIYNAPVIEFSSLGSYSFNLDIVGAKTHPFLYPDLFHRRIYNMTVWEKINELYLHYSINSIFVKIKPLENEILREIFGPSAPSIDDIRQNVQMLFLNVHPIWDFNRPVPPNVVYLGGLHQKPQRDLPQDLKSYLDSSTNGVIYISFGTNVKPSMLPAEKLKIFTDVFSKLPYDVLWKWDNDEIPGRSKNVRISKWLPQSDLLRHPKIKLFITQGGLQSTDEAITAGVPLIGVPMLGDQWFNVEHYVKLNIGERILIDKMTEDELIITITKVINNKSYRENIVKLSNIMNDQPQKPLERAVWWTEHVLRHGGRHLRASGAGVSRTEYYELELVLLLIASLAVVSIATVLATCFIVNTIRRYIRVKVKVN
ncbi:UDP-glycosyltransferase UGT5-like [Melitaea cinxia]|uniref:UDP-glycosyltransferase UGT5-like n=1 Tax=Melitaea cinxia TaxID=113334 RepID=UPI001E27335C|nr:UDP-glycosyltransferase UGT5-like [Melitaea cinxia]